MKLKTFINNHCDLQYHGPENFNTHYKNESGRPQYATKSN